MNREAVALGTPVYTTFEGRLGAVDEALLRDGRLRRLTNADDVRVERRTRARRLAGSSRPARTRHTPAFRRRPMRALTTSVNARRLGQVGVDACLLGLAYYLAYVLRFDSGIPHRYEVLLSDTIALTVADEARDLRDVRALLEALAFRRSEGLRVDPQGRGGLDRRPDRGAVPVLDRQARPAAWRARARLPALARVRVRCALRGARNRRATRARHDPGAGGTRGADRRCRQRRPAGGLRAAPQSRPAQRARRLRGRRPAQAGHAHRRHQGARRHAGPDPRPRRRAARRGDHRHPVGAGHAPPARGHGLSRARHSGAHAAHDLRAAHRQREPDAAGARGARGGRARARARCAWRSTASARTCAAAPCS